MNNQDDDCDAAALYYDHAVARGWMRPTSQARSRQMCERILDAADREFARRGYEATTIAQISAAAGCSVGIFYKRFQGKDGLFNTLQYRHVQDGRRRLNRLTHMAQSDLTTEDIFRRFVRSTATNMINQAGFERALVEQSLKSPRVWQTQREFNTYAGDRLLDFLIARGDLAEPDQDIRDRCRFAVRLVFSALLNMIVLGPGPYEPDDERVVSTLAGMLRGFLRDAQHRRK